MTTFTIPRGFAAGALAAIVAAIVQASTGNFAAFAMLAVVAAILAWMAVDLSRVVVRHLELERLYVRTLARQRAWERIAPFTRLAALPPFDQDEGKLTVAEGGQS